MVTCRFGAARIQLSLCTSLLLLRHCWLFEWPTRYQRTHGKQWYSCACSLTKEVEACLGVQACVEALLLTIGLAAVAWDIQPCCWYVRAEEYIPCHVGRWWPWSKQTHVCGASAPYYGVWPATNGGTGDLSCVGAAGVCCMPMRSTPAFTSTDEVSCVVLMHGGVRREACCVLSTHGGTTRALSGHSLLGRLQQCGREHSQAWFACSTLWA
jgi:hypothetical protein